MVDVGAKLVGRHDSSGLRVCSSDVDFKMHNWTRGSTSTDVNASWHPSVPI